MDIFCFVASLISDVSNPWPSVDFRDCAIRLWERLLKLDEDFFGMKKMLRFSGTPGVGARMIPV